MNVFYLPNQWNDALKYAKEYYEERQIPIIKLSLNERYTAEIDKKNAIVKVGCQTFSFDVIDQLHKKCFLKNN